MSVDRDWSDLGVKWAAEAEEHDEPQPEEVHERPPTTRADREQALAALRHRMGWGPSRASRLAVGCECGAAPGEWCSRPSRRRSGASLGRLCSARGVTER